MNGADRVVRGADFWLLILRYFVGALSACTINCFVFSCLKYPPCCKLLYLLSQLISNLGFVELWGGLGFTVQDDSTFHRSYEVILRTDGWQTSEFGISKVWGKRGKRKSREREFFLMIGL